MQIKTDYIYEYMDVHDINTMGKHTRKQITNDICYSSYDTQFHTHNQNSCKDRETNKRNASIAQHHVKHIEHEIDRKNHQLLLKEILLRNEHEHEQKKKICVNDERRSTIQKENEIKNKTRKKNNNNLEDDRNTWKEKGRKKQQVCRLIKKETPARRRVAEELRRQRQKEREQKKRERKIKKMEHSKKKRGKNTSTWKNIASSRFTIFVCQIPLCIDERAIFDFFSKAGRVKDIDFPRDPRTKASKGIAFVVFTEERAVEKALNLSRTPIIDVPSSRPIMVYRTQSKESRKIYPPIMEESGICIYFGKIQKGLPETHILQVFEAFGPIDSIDLYKHPDTGSTTGAGSVQYKKKSDGLVAISALNGLEIAGELIEISLNLSDIDKHKKLRKNTNAFLIATSNHQNSTCIVMQNMFDPQKENDGEFETDLKDDITVEAQKFGRLRHVFVDRHTGNVYLRFSTSQESNACVNAFNGRWFASRQIQANFISECQYIAQFPDSAVISSQDINQQHVYDLNKL